MKSKLVFFPLLLAVVFPFSSPFAYGATLSFSAQGITGSSLVRGQDNVPLLAFSASCDDAGSITGITVTYSGDAGSDIASGSVRLFQDGDGDLSTAGDRTQLGPGLSFSGLSAAFSGFTVACDSNTVRHFVVTASIASSAAGGNAVSAAVGSAGDIVSPDAVVTGSFPLNSLGGSPHHTTASATKLLIGSLPATVAAGQAVSVSVSAVDDLGTVDTQWTGSTLSIGGTPGYEPGTAPDGSPPGYSGGGPWSAADHGHRTCSFTLYKAESGRKIRIADPVLGTYDRDITVNPAGTGRTGILPVSDQTAGVPFTVTVYTADHYGNPGTGHAGSAVTLSAGPNIGASPAGNAPAFPAAYVWRGDEPQGQKVFSVVLYDQCTGGQLRVSDTALGSAVSNSFEVGEGAIARYAISGPVSVALKTRTTYTLSAEDSWGNPLAKYNGSAQVSVSDTRAVLPVTSPVAAGTAVFAVLFMTWGNHVIAVQDAGTPSIKGSLAVVVERAPAATSFKVTTPVSIEGGKPFPARIVVCNDLGEAVPEYGKTVHLSVTAPATVSPGTVVIANGAWEGNLTISGETLQAKITVSDGVITTVNAGLVLIGVDDYRKARTYPTVFTPAKGPVRIRYFLREDREVKVRVYNTLKDLVREMRFPAGSAGGQQGLNVVEWNGKGGDGDVTGHSGAYHILIDKGYEKEWTGAVIRNF